MKDVSFREAVAEIVDAIFPCSMEIGKTLKHPDGRTVKIKSGCYKDPNFGRISNFWTWNEVLKDGSLGPDEHGYGW